MKDDKNKKKLDMFNVVLLGIVFDPEKKQILLGRRENDLIIPKLRWCFPGGRLNNGKEDVDKALKRQIKQKTGYGVKNLGAVFARIPPEKEDMAIIYFLCEVFEGKKNPGDGIKELRWVNPEEVEAYFKTSFNSRLKEYIMNLK
ncbi:MAG TPA: NUDIX hydrolase [Candidatus Nanoarchaeia archaeon]|nr:NUDIX hydrolase [Candidatus Nanoarchaeia archaeon]